MTTAEFAEFYVMTIEPTLRVLFFFLVAIFLIWLFMLLKSGEKKGDIINAIVTGLWKGFVATALFIGAAIAWFFKMIIRIITVAVASIRDFFTSEV